MKSTPNLAQTGTPSDLAGSKALDDCRLVDLKWVFCSILKKVVFSTEDFEVWGLLHHHHESENIISIQTHGLCSRCVSEILMNKFDEITYDLHPYEVGCQHYEAFRAALLFRAIKISIF